MRSVTLSVLLAVLSLSSVRAQELMPPVAVAGGSGSLYLAYADNTVWYTEGFLIEIPCANRGLAIRAMYPLPGGASAVCVLYDDNELWYVGAHTACQFGADMSRPDDPTLRPIAIGEGSGTGIVAAFEDGQIWAWSDGQIHRVEMWERLAEPTTLQRLNWGTLKQGFAAPMEDPGK